MAEKNKMVDITLLKKLRNETSVSLADCRKALEEASNDYKKALDVLRKNGLEKAAKKAATSLSAPSNGQTNLACCTCMRFSQHFIAISARNDTGYHLC